MVLYHLAPVSRLDAILATGLDPALSESSLKAVFLADCKDRALSYTCMKDEPCVLLEVTVSPELEDLGPDNYELRDALLEMTPAERESYDLWDDASWADCSWEQSLAISGQVACYSVIPAKQVRLLT